MMNGGDNWSRAEALAERRPLRVLGPSRHVTSCCTYTAQPEHLVAFTPAFRSNQLGLDLGELLLELIRLDLEKQPGEAQMWADEDASRV